jgi:8-oxo-dGTP pyrophosphatase MutT (NUDIX family)
VRREFVEEIGAELQDIRYLGMLENIFTCEGARGHEIVLVYDGSLVERSLYHKDFIQGDELGMAFKAYWKSLSGFSPGKPPLYPDGLQDLLAK